MNKHLTFLAIICFGILISGCYSEEEEHEPVEHEPYIPPGPAYVNGLEHFSDFTDTISMVIEDDPGIVFMELPEEAVIPGMKQGALEIVIFNRSLTQDERNVSLIQYSEILYYENEELGEVYFIFSNHLKIMQFMNKIMEPEVKERIIEEFERIQLE